MFNKPLIFINTLDTVTLVCTISYLKISPSSNGTVIYIMFFPPQREIEMLFQIFFKIIKNQYKYLFINLLFINTYIVKHNT